jgi:hypothetical protein
MRFSMQERVLQSVVLAERFRKKSGWLGLPYTSNQLATDLDISQAHAYRILAAARRAGLVAREAAEGRTGGKAYNYYATVQDSERERVFSTGRYLLNKAGVAWI